MEMTFWRRPLLYSFSNIHLDHMFIYSYSLHKRLLRPRKKSEDQIEINSCFLSLALIADFINDTMLTLLAFMHWVISLNLDGNEFLKNHKNCV